MNDDASTQAPEYKKEVRLAIVMYGGVSLAIYINGIAQEFLRLVRSTAAPGASGTKPAGSEPLSSESCGTTPRKTPVTSESVYRKVAWLMANEGKGAEDYQPEMPCDTRFLIDIISGTSAGGINGIFLAKALANRQEMQDLERLWVKEGDIALLINDKESRVGNLPLRDPPESLLNSQRMYVKLLEAFSGMDSGGEGNGYVEDLDLYVTTTDLQGVALPLRLADRVVYERRHRNVFHFAYSSTESGSSKFRNDFGSDKNPFLAFAARCTSSFPFAFEPMKLTDIDAALRLFPKYNDPKYQANSPAWCDYYHDYQNLPAEVRSRVRFQDRSFGDGGYLDNKPFSYSIEALTSRQAEIPVDRKLIYIEPSPEHPELDPGTSDRPDLIQNVTACLLTLPRYETIREDLQRVLERNRLLARINRILDGLKRDVEQLRSLKLEIARDRQCDQTVWLPDEEWAQMGLAELLARRGRGYIAYHRLMIASITDELADIITRVIDTDERSDYRVAVRCLVRAWRDRTFTETPETGNGKLPINSFALDFDLCYPLRRIAFLREKVDEEFRTAKRSPEELRSIKKELNTQWHCLKDLQRELRSPKESPLKRYLRPGESAETNCPLAAQPGCALAGEESVARDVANRYPISWKVLDRILGRTDGEQGKPSGEDDAGTSEKMLDLCDARARAFLEGANGGDKEAVSELFKAIADTIRSRISECVARADEACLKVLGLPLKATADYDPRSETDPLKYYYLNYDLFDMITFPILYETGMGETDNVEVIRISPEDATSLIDEGTTKSFKLAGTKLWHFGGFMEERWRKNDIFWGRLDGAERLIQSMLPGHPDLETLIGEAQAAIVCEVLERLGETEKYQLLAESMMRTEGGISKEDSLVDFVTRLKKKAGKELGPRLEALIDNNVLRQYYLDNFKTQRQLPPEDTLRTAARATTVVGRMLEGLTEKYGFGKKYAAYLVRLGRIFWGLVEVAVPQSIGNLLVRHWLFVLYLAEVLLLVGGLLFGSNGVRNVAIELLVLTLLVDAVILSFNCKMSNKRWWLWMRRLLRPDEMRDELTWRSWVTWGVLVVLGAILLLVLGRFFRNFGVAFANASCATGSDIRCLFSLCWWR